MNLIDVLKGGLKNRHLQFSKYEDILNLRFFGSEQEELAKNF